MRFCSASNSMSEVPLFGASQSKGPAAGLLALDDSEV